MAIVKFEGGCIILWAYFTGKGAGKIIKLNGITNLLVSGRNTESRSSVGVS